MGSMSLRVGAVSFPVWRQISQRMVGVADEAKKNTLHFFEQGDFPVDFLDGFGNMASSQLTVSSFGLDGGKKVDEPPSTSRTNLD